MFDIVKNLVNGVELPTLYVSENVLDKIVEGGLQYIEDETGEAMIGLIMKDKDSGKTAVYILDTIVPGEGAVRESHTFQQGGEWQDDVLDWLRKNWEVARKQRATASGSSVAKWDAQLYHVGDWHKQPGWMVHPSGGDLHTALDFINDPKNQIGFLVAPILTINHPATVADIEKQSNFLVKNQGDGQMSRIDFWYIARGMMNFAPITAHVLPTRNFPRLMPYPWHLVSETRAFQEMQLLENDGMMVEAMVWNTDEQLPLEVCFITARPGASHFLVVATPADYPNNGPDVYTVPFAGLHPGEDIYELMTRQWTYAELVEEPEGFEWSPGKTMLEMVYMAEDTLGWSENPLEEVGEAADGPVAEAEPVPAEASPEPTPDEDKPE
jgi:hypothetical protein